MIVSAFLTIATFPRLDFYILGFIALIPLLKSLHKAKSSKKRFFVGFSYSIIILSVYHLWMFELTPWASFLSIFVLWLINSAYNALFYGVGCIIYGYIRTEKNELWLFPCCWTLIEWIRSLGPIGNPAAGMGYSQSLNEWILPLASGFGVFGICWIVCFYNSLISQYLNFL